MTLGQWLDRQPRLRGRPLSAEQGQRLTLIRNVTGMAVFGCGCWLHNWPLIALPLAPALFSLLRLIPIPLRRRGPGPGGGSTGASARVPRRPLPPSDARGIAVPIPGVEVPVR